jgi:hypothetical protein
LDEFTELFLRFIVSDLVKLALIKDHVLLKAYGPIPITKLEHNDRWAVYAEPSFTLINDEIRRVI